MSKYLLIFSLLIFGSLASASIKPTVLVSVPPQKFLVEKIADGTVNVSVIVPPGASPHSYEPTPHQIIDIRQGKIWFRIGEGFEERLIGLMKDTRIIDQREGLELLPLSCGCCVKGAQDLHIWLSPHFLKQMSFQIYKVLCENFPENASNYKKRYETLISELNQLDVDISRLLKDSRGKSILVSHPAYAYFCQEYGIEQISIESEGREPNTRYLAEIYKKARFENIQTVFLQTQYNVKGGTKIAKDLNAKTVFLDPYSENVIENLKSIAEAFSKS